jgi:predicted nucleic acid-binding protein
LPGQSNRSTDWGDLPLVVDTSAWARAHRPEVRARWTDALRADRLRLSAAARLEILLAARNGDAFDELAQELAALRPAPLTATVIRAGQAAMRALAHRSAGAHRIPIVDYLLAAAAGELGAAVLHYDRDYDTLAEVVDFDSVWISPPGSLS